MELRINRKWQTTESTYSEYSVAGGLQQGYLLEGPGPDCTSTALGKRIPDGRYTLKLASPNKSAQEKRLCIYNAHVSGAVLTASAFINPSATNLVITGERGSLPPGDASQRLNRLHDLLHSVGLEQVAVIITSHYPLKIIWMKQFRKLYGPYVTEEFRKQLLAVAERLGIEADYIMACIALETGRQFSPRIKNPGSSATGLIQFMEQTAKDLGTTTLALTNMGHVEQLAYIERYFNLKARQVGVSTSKWTLQDVYYSIFSPQTIKKPLDQAIYKSGESKAYSKNQFHDRNKDGVITKREIAENIVSYYEAGKGEAG